MLKNSTLTILPVKPYPIFSINSIYSSEDFYCKLWFIFFSNSKRFSLDPPRILFSKWHFFLSIITIKLIILHQDKGDIYQTEISCCRKYCIQLKIVLVFYTKWELYNFPSKPSLCIWRYFSINFTRNMPVYKRYIKDL